MNSPAEESPGAQESTPLPSRILWLLLLVCLLGPAILTCLTTLIDHSSGSPSPGVAIIGGLFGGIGFGVMLGRRLGRTAGLQIVFGLILAVIGAVASITIATIGCLASGYHLDLR